MSWEAEVIDIDPGGKYLLALVTFGEKTAFEAAWSYRHRPSVGESLRKRQAVISEEIREIAWKAQHRLHTRYRKLMARGKEKQKVVTAL
jgi:transposase